MRPAVGALIAFVLPALPTYIVVRRLSKETGAAVAAALTPGLGLGVASCLYFLELLILRSHQRAIWLDGAVWLAANVWCASRYVGSSLNRYVGPSFRSGDRVSPDLKVGPTYERGQVIIAAAAAMIVCALAAVQYWLQWSLNPYGMWDAWAIWNHRARAIFRGAPDWSAVFSPLIGWANPDYPPLLPVTIARVWAYQGRETSLVPAIVQIVFAGGSTAVVATLAARYRGWIAGSLSIVALLMVRTFVFQAACQCADVPIAFYILVAVAFLALALHDARPAPFMAVAGLATGFAVLTKNEGTPLLFLALVCAACKAPRPRALAQFVSGLALPAFVLAVFKLGLAPSNYLFTRQAAIELANKLGDASRWTMVFGQLSQLLPSWGEVRFGAILCLVLGVALTARPTLHSLRRAATAWLVAGAVFFSYAVIYVITPLPLDWQIATSFDRLVTQLWPALVWAAFLL